MNGHALLRPEELPPAAEAVRETVVLGRDHKLHDEMVDVGRFRVREELLETGRREVVYRNAARRCTGTSRGQEDCYDIAHVLGHSKQVVDTPSYLCVGVIDMPNILGKTCWNVNRGLPPFPTFIPAKDEDLSRMATEECQLVSLPLYNRFMDEPHVTALVSQSDVDDARAAKPVAAPVKKNYIDYKKWLENRRKFAKKRREMRKVRLRGLRERAKERQDEARAEKLLKYRRVK